MINLTENAVKAVNRFIENSEKKSAGLRIRVEAGGCSGFQYGLKLEEQPESSDTVEEILGLKVFMDENSMPLLENVTVDFVEGMEGSGFKFENPNATANCGCGKSFACG